ncbi:MAG: 4-alpha-glucanotransferase [Deltaproteobacteria bacterium]|nr:4-alpha-glucanotransferase [Deltaproteobacteria bacterium]
MKSRNELIDELAILCGIVLEYWDIYGNKYVASNATKESILRSMGIRIDSDEEIAQEIERIRLREWTTLIEPVRVLSVDDQPFKIDLHLPLDEAQEESLFIIFSTVDEVGNKDEFTLSKDSFHVIEQRWIDGKRYVKVELPYLIRRDIGYYTLYITCNYLNGQFTVNSRLIIAPNTCYIPTEFLNGSRKLWGLTLNLYSLSSEKNWGCGDFKDLDKISKWLSELGGGFIAINPLHALLNKMPFDISPYSPISRLYKNFIYLDMDNIADVLESVEAQSFMQSDSFKGEIERLRQSDLIDYEATAMIKEKILRYAFEQFYREHYLKGTPRGKTFQKYLEKEGEPLESFCLYLALFRKHNLSDWRQWMPEYQNPSDESVEVSVKENEREILFYSYVQWLIDSQLEKISNDLGKTMSLGLMFDLAIGSNRCGSDVWRYRDLFALGINVGAPPDEFNPKGQDWGFPPLIPQRLKETGYEFFIQTIRKNMQHAKALRIDHALGLFRLFWIPEGGIPAEGAYVIYPSEDLLRIIALESVRNKTMVIAEDLGTVGENVHERLQQYNMLSYKLLYFERNYPEPSFKIPQNYWHKALTAVTTHDLATCYGFWVAQDIEVKRNLGLYPDYERYLRHLADRKRDKELLLKALMEEGVLQGEGDLFDHYLVSEMDSTLCKAIYEYLSRAPCMLLSVSLDDVLGTINQQNLPGVIETYPCWRQKTILNIEAIIEDKRFKELAEAFKRNNR